VGCCQHGNGPSGSIKVGEIFTNAVTIGSHEEFSSILIIIIIIIIIIIYFLLCGGAEIA
jgi:hypothetical protein